MHADRWIYNTKVSLLSGELSLKTICLIGRKSLHPLFFHWRLMISTSFRVTRLSVVNSWPFSFPSTPRIQRESRAIDVNNPRFIRNSYCKSQGKTFYSLGESYWLVLWLDEKLKLNPRSVQSVGIFYITHPLTRWLHVGCMSNKWRLYVHIYLLFRDICYVSCSKCPRGEDLLLRCRTIF